MFKVAGYNVTTVKHALSEAELKEKLRGVHALGIRSKTNVTKEVLESEAAKDLLAIGCFCIGTNQVDLDAAAAKGVAVFNSPFCNSRSVAELMVCEIIALYRQLGDRNNEMHRGTWKKTSVNCHEIRSKVLGIVGYGHIGTQLSVLAESIGMNVIFYDILQIMPLGTAKPVKNLHNLLKHADVVTLHVPETPETKNMMTATEFSMMKKGALFINASRGTVVDLKALQESLKSGHLGGAAIDVYPEEPAANSDNFQHGFDGCPNVILTPHIGGSTEEAQSAIGQEVATAMVKFVNNGTSMGCVNLPEVDIKFVPGTTRIVNIHQNVPGVLKQINKLLGNYNIEKQISESRGHFALLIADISGAVPEECKNIVNAINALPESISTRLVE